MLYHIICCDHDFYVGFPSVFHSSNCSLPSPLKKEYPKKGRDEKTIADYTFIPPFKGGRKTSNCTVMLAKGKTSFVCKEMQLLSTRKTNNEKILTTMCARMGNRFSFPKMPRASAEWDIFIFFLNALSIFYAPRFCRQRTRITMKRRMQPDVHDQQKKGGLANIAVDVTCERRHAHFKTPPTSLNSDKHTHKAGTGRG